MPQWMNHELKLLKKQTPKKKIYNHLLRKRSMYVNTPSRITHSKRFWTFYLTISLSCSLLVEWLLLFSHFTDVSFALWSACRSGENWNVEIWIHLWDGKRMLQDGGSQPCKYLNGHPKCTDKWAHVFPADHVYKLWWVWIDQRVLWSLQKRYYSSAGLSHEDLHNLQ